MHQSRSVLHRLHLPRPVAVIVLLAGILGFLPPVAAPAAPSKPLFEEIGALERFPADARAVLGTRYVPTYAAASVSQKQIAGTAIVIHEARQLWQLYPAGDGTESTAVVVRDLDTLGIERTLVLGSLIDRATIEAGQGGEWSHAIDNKGTRLWLLQSPGHRFVHEIDLRTFRAQRRLLLADAVPSPPIIVGGLTYDRFEDDLLLLYGGPGGVFGPANTNVHIHRLDVSGPPPAQFPTDEMQRRFYRMRSCTGPVTSTDAPAADTTNWELLVSKNYLYVPCHRAGHTVVIVRTPRADGQPLQHPEDVAAGPVYGASVLADQESGRLFVTTTRREIWAFETSTMAFVGVVATGPEETERLTGFGLDQVTGRVFFQSPSFGLGVVEGRFFPIPQARTMNRLAIAQERIWSDAATNRIFVLEGDGVVQGTGTVSKAPAYRVYRTDTAPVPPPPPDPDRNTANVDEKEGVTEARYNATGSGYGTRVLLAKGFATVPPAPTLGVLAPSADAIGTANSKCGFTDRMLVAGRVAKAEYDTGSTAAEAIAVDVDDTTKQDIGQPSRCDLRAFSIAAALSPLDGKAKWDYKSATCAVSTQDEGGRTADGTGGSVSTGPSTATCPLPGELLRARAESRVAGGIQVDRSFTETTIERTASGVTAQVTAVAQGVSITLGEGTEATTVVIGEIKSTAVSTSNGRPKRGYMSTHEVDIADVSIGGSPVCAANCDPEWLERQLNLLSAGRAVFRTGLGPNSGRDPALLEGSPRGAQTAVQKSVARQASDRALMGDFTTEIPGFEVTVFNDNTEWGRARQLYQFAGVAASATYNVVLHPTFGPLGDDDGLPDVVAPPGETPFTGLVENVDGIPSATIPLEPVVGRRLVEGDGDDESGDLATIVKAVARGLRLFLTSPRTALLLLSAWALLGSPAVLSRRRRRLVDLG